MGLKNIYEMDNISIGDPSKADKYLLTPPVGEVDFPEREIKIPVNVKHFQTIVIDEPSIKVGPEPFSDKDM